MHVHIWDAMLQTLHICADLLYVHTNYAHKLHFMYGFSFDLKKYNTKHNR